VALSAPVLALPFVGSLPDHPPEAVQLLALVEDQLSIEDPPLLTVVGLALRPTVGGAATLTATDWLALPPGPLQVSVKAVVALSAPVLALPLVGSLPDQPPEPVQLLVFVEDQLSIDEPPVLTVAGLALRLTVGLPAAAFTLMVKAGSVADALPSLTLITMPESVPTSAAAGVPLSCPVVVSNLAQGGLFVMENVRLFPDGSLAVGAKEYAVPAVTLVPGVPEIAGPAAPDTTVIAKAGREALATPSLTLITIPLSVPTSAAAGTPLSCPLAMLKLAHEGLLLIENVRPLPAGSLAVGMNEYAIPTVALAPGEPEIEGPATTAIVNAGSDALVTPSLTLMTMPE
jgi:hypothetical protein